MTYAFSHDVLVGTDVALVALFFCSSDFDPASQIATPTGLSRFSRSRPQRRPSRKVAATPRLGLPDVATITFLDAGLAWPEVLIF